jgi:hypothetical protein
MSLPPQSPGRADGKLEEAIQHSHWQIVVSI